MSYAQEIAARFPVRRKEEQKKAFRDWLLPELRAMGYSPRLEQCGSAMTHQHIVIGNPEQAPVLFTAHYDTPGAALFPDIRLPRNPVLYFLYQLLVVIVLLLIATVFLVGTALLTGNTTLALSLWMLFYVVILMVSTYAGAANKHNMNASSGLAAMLELLAALPEEDRAKAAFVLFDNETKGFSGSKAYCKAHQQVAYTRMTVNLDHLGVGDSILLISRKLARQHLTYAPLERHLAAIQPQTARFFDSMGGVCNTSYKQFKSGANLCACKRMPVVGYYIPNLGTRFDKHINENNLTQVAGALCAYLNELTL